MINKERFDIIIPTWNNLKYLKASIGSIRLNSAYMHSIYVHVNEGTDGTIEWLKENNIEYTYFSQNKGVCEGTNLASKLGNNNYVVYFNDDMFALPKWDYEIMKQFQPLQKLNIEKFLLCCTPIEPTGDNPNCIVKNYGNDIDNFNIIQLLSDLEELKLIKSNMNSTWSPMIIPRKLWEEIGGFSAEFEPGFGSDPDICKKIYDVGCRHFVGVGRSLIYHFQTKTTSKVPLNNSREIFFKKHGITIDDFVYKTLKRGEIIL